MKRQVWDLSREGEETETVNPQSSHKINLSTVHNQ